MSGEQELQFQESFKFNVNL